jgi:ribosomal protein S18 acetylase RimI-like enzyme
MIRPMKKEEIKRILEFSKETDVFTDKEIDDLQESLEYEPTDFYVKKCFVEGSNIIGCICYGEAGLAKYTYDIFWIMVDPKHQNKGIGGMLLKHAEDEMKGRGAKLLVMQTSSIDKYLPTRSFYEKKGYKIEGRIKDYYNKDDDLVIFVKRF